MQFLLIFNLIKYLI